MCLQSFGGSTWLNEQSMTCQDGVLAIICSCVVTFRKASLGFPWNDTAFHKNERESSKVFPGLVSGVTQYHFLCILQVKDKDRVSPDSRDKGNRCYLFMEGAAKSH